MRIIEQSFEILRNDVADPECLKRLERIIRVCYKSEEKISDSNDSYKTLIAKIVGNGHEAMIEHLYLTVKFTVDRGVSHELVRHRLASYAQESTRYCDYADDKKFSDGLTFVRPPFFDNDSSEYKTWFLHMQVCENAYLKLRHDSVSPELARSVLPNALKTEIVVTANLREWKHIFALRCSPHAHPQMSQIMVPLRITMQMLAPTIFGYATRVKDAK